MLNHIMKSRKVWGVTKKLEGGTLRESACFRSYYGPYFPALLCISPYSVRMRENTDQNNSEYRHFLRSRISKSK